MKKVRPPRRRLQPHLHVRYDHTQFPLQSHDYILLLAVRFHAPLVECNRLVKRCEDGVLQGSITHKKESPLMALQ